MIFMSLHSTCALVGQRINYRLEMTSVQLTVTVLRGRERCRVYVIRFDSVGLQDRNTSRYALTLTLSWFGVHPVGRWRLLQVNYFISRT